MLGNSSENVSNPLCEGLEGRDERKQEQSNTSRCSGFWKVEPGLGKLADGISFRVDKLRALGNSVVPQQVKEAFEILIGSKFLKDLNL